MQLERSNGFAYIIAHIPPHDCLHEFGIRYKALMERYQYIVRWSSFGHSHNEQFRVSKAIDTEDPMAWYLISGSATADGRNPGFTVVDFDAEFMVPVNIHTYAMDLVEANKNKDKEPEFKYLHDFISEYSLEDLSPSSMKELTERLAKGGKIAARYEWNKSKRVGKEPTPWGQNDAYLCL